MPDDDNRIAERLVAAMTDAGNEATRKVIVKIVARTRADIPPTDPREGRNPDPQRPPLKDSIHVRHFGNFWTVSVEAPHAVKQHEALHFKHPRGGRAKYLERNVLLALREWEGELTASVRTNLATGRVRTRAGLTGLRD
jgi:hypothetical protein